MQQQRVPRPTGKEAKAKVNQDREELLKIRDVAPKGCEKFSYHSLLDKTEVEQSGVSFFEVPPDCPDQDGKGKYKYTDNWVLRLEPESRTVPDCSSSGYRVNLLKGSAKLTLFETSSKNVVEKLRIGHTRFIDKNNVFAFENTTTMVCYIWLIECTSGKRVRQITAKDTVRKKK